jgi:chaperonin GroEL (HSP60 family)
MHLNAVPICRVAVQACIAVCPKNPASFNVDNVRVVKIPGGGVTDSAVVRGMVSAMDSVQDLMTTCMHQGTQQSCEHDAA